MWISQDKLQRIYHRHEQLQVGERHSNRENETNIDIEKST